MQTSPTRTIDSSEPPRTVGTSEGAWTFQSAESTGNQRPIGFFTDQEDPRAWQGAATQEELLDRIPDTTAQGNTIRTYTFYPDDESLKGIHGSAFGIYGTPLSINDKFGLGSPCGQLAHETMAPKASPLRKHKRFEEVFENQPAQKRFRVRIIQGSIGNPQGEEYSTSQMFNFSAIDPALFDDRDLTFTDGPTDRVTDPGVEEETSPELLKFPAWQSPPSTGDRPLTINRVNYPKLNSSVYVDIP